MRSIKRTSWPIVAAFVLPSLLGFIIFIALPIFFAIGISLTDYSGGSKFQFTGLKNYVVAFHSALFLKSLWVTVVFTFWVVLFQILLGLAFALWLNDRIFGRNFFRSVIFMPNVLSSVAISLAFMLILDPQRGPLNQLLRHLGLPTSPWLGGEGSALPTIIMVTVWQSFGYYMVLFLGGLQTISRTLYEAAAIDGASSVRRFFAVTLPGLSPIMFYSITIAIIRAFQVFDQVFVMTGGQSGGGPAGATSVLVFDIYKNGFSQFRFGYAGAESIILLGMVMIITVIQQRGQKKWVNYDVV